MFYMHDIGWEAWVLMSIGMVAFWGLMIAGLVMLVRGRIAESHQPRKPEVGRRRPTSS
jgi:hypothetical protein